MRLSRIVPTAALGAVMTLAMNSYAKTPTQPPAWIPDATASLEQEIVRDHGETQRAPLHRGLQQIAGFWREEDGDRAAFEAFVRRNYAADPGARDALFRRFEALLESLDGHLNEVVLAFRAQSDLDRGEILPVDEMFGAWDPAAHVGDDMFENKLAFAALLNFPLTTLEQRLREGEGWSRREWAEARLASRFSRRVPAEVNQAIAAASSAAEQYIAGYNIWMHHLVTDSGERPFPAKLRLLSHWNLRDEIKARYGDPEEELGRQRMIQKVMERIVTQTIPAAVIDNPHVDWNPETNEVRAAAAQDSDSSPPAGMQVSSAPEPDTRYAVLLDTYRGVRRLDPYSPTAPTHIARRFDEDREIPEDRVREMFERILTSSHLRRVAALVTSRLGRPLEPFDIWYNGFRPKGAFPEAELDAVVRERYPTPEAYHRGMPDLLRKLGFPRERTEYLAEHILVEPARGSGHAWGAEMRAAPARLRTRVGPEGMDFKGFNIAVHEMGHNVEQVLSLNDIDHWTLRGVPNTAFTEALAFVFQERDMELLGLASRDPRAEAMQALDTYWATCEIGAVALVDMAVWHWMYDHPDATAAALKEATVGIAKDVWNRYYAPIFGVKDSVLLGIYSHMIHSFLYLPDYPIGHMIAFQINEQIRKAGTVGPEFERMVKSGNIAPDLWMKNATGRPVGPEALLEATERALAEIGG